MIKKIITLLDILFNFELLEEYDKYLQRHILDKKPQKVEYKNFEQMFEL